jgi:hypothetical protein
MTMTIDTISEVTDSKLVSTDTRVVIATVTKKADTRDTKEIRVTSIAEIYKTPLTDTNDGWEMFDPSRMVIATDTAMAFGQVIRLKTAEKTGDIIRAAPTIKDTAILRTK